MEHPVTDSQNPLNRSSASTVDNHATCTNYWKGKEASWNDSHGNASWKGKGEDNNWWPGYGNAEHFNRKGDYTPCPKFDTITQANYKSFEVAVTRWVRPTDHRVDVRAFKLIHALPVDLQNNFLYESNETLMSEAGVAHVLNQISLHIGRRPGEEEKKTMD